jgi:hypothetical protein
MLHHPLAIQMAKTSPATKAPPHMSVLRMRVRRGCSFIAGV